MEVPGIDGKEFEINIDSDKFAYNNIHQDFIDKSIQYMIETWQQHAIDAGVQLTDKDAKIEELYEHRNMLWITVCKLWLQGQKKYDEGQLDFDKPVWRSEFHSDGSRNQGWFLLGLTHYKWETRKDEQLTYHLPISNWVDCNFAYTLAKAPEFDGHTSQDVLKRLKEL